MSDLKMNTDSVNVVADSINVINNQIVSDINGSIIPIIDSKV